MDLAETFHLPVVYLMDCPGFAVGLDQEGHDFITGQMLKGSQMLGDLWLTAWKQAPPDTFLRTQLAKRKLPREALAR